MKSVGTTLLKALALPISALALSVLACFSSGAERKPLNLYPSPSSEAEAVRVITTTPLPTQPTFTPITVVYTSTSVPTPTPTIENYWLCVTAQEAVNLRPSPSTENHIAVLRNGDRVRDLGGRNGSWVYVETGNKRGWVNGKYLKSCR